MVNHKENNFDINFYAVLMIGALAFLIFVVGCDSPKHSDEESTEDTTAMSSTITPDTEANFASLDDENNNADIKDFTEKHPNMEYTYIQTEDGKVATIKGDYKTKMDQVNDEDDLNKFVSFVESNYANQELSKSEYNKNVEVPAQPKKGYNAYYKAVKNNIEFPEEALDNDVKGTVIVEFIVNENGYISDVQAMEGMYYTKDKNFMNQLDNAAVAAVKNTHWKWTPAKQGNENVKMKLELPITFQSNG